jgi:hypothetical protein
MGLKPGTRLKSGVSDAQFVVIRASEGDTTLTAGGVDTVALDSDTPPMDIVGDNSGEVLVGKRYVDELDTFEVLCTKTGLGDLAIDNRPLRAKSAKPLPSSD